MLIIEQLSNKKVLTALTNYQDNQFVDLQGFFQVIVSLFLLAVRVCRKVRCWDRVHSDQKILFATIHLFSRGLVSSSLQSIRIPHPLHDNDVVGTLYQYDESQPRWPSQPSQQYHLLQKEELVKAIMYIFNYVHKTPNNSYLSSMQYHTSKWDDH